MKIVCRYRKTISMSRVYDLERLISSCSDSDSELSSLYEDETACIRRFWLWVVIPIRGQNCMHKARRLYRRANFGTYKKSNFGDERSVGHTTP